ncbi:hypothetical protein [Lacrimispora xylanisolvens]|uniref:hypothetical protein n=1 Tax=Lacrimispora xylanisolvens TaxID=384636 RepID=UPI002402D0FB
MERKNREIQYDYLRVIAVIAIIMVHSIPAQAANDTQQLLVQCLCLCFCLL